MIYYREDPGHPEAPSTLLSIDPADYFTAGLNQGTTEAHADLAAAIDTAAALARSQRNHGEGIRVWGDLLAREFAAGYSIAVDQITMVRALLMEPGDGN